MSNTEFSTNTRVPTLVQLCQRVASSCVESITTLGNDLSYPLVKPILERCSEEQLLELEGSSPHLLNDTLEIWMQSCIRKFPAAVEKYLDDDLLEPISWRDRYMILKHEEERRFERLGSKLKAQRIEAEERKKEREIKFTDRVPPPKRPRTGGWGAPVQPKTLIQKTLSEASRIQKAVYHSRMIPPMNGGKTYRVLPKPSCTITPASSPSNPSRVSVNIVKKRAISGPSNRNTPHRSSPSSTSSVPQLSPGKDFSRRSGTSSVLAPETASTVPKQPESTTEKILRGNFPSNASLDTRPVKPMMPPKKDPMSSLFVPKHRAYSQRPV